MKGNRIMDDEAPSAEREIRINRLAAKLSEQIFNVLPPPRNAADPQEYWEAVLMAFGITLGSMITKSPFSHAEQISHWNLICQYALTQVILPEQEKEEERAGKLADFLAGDWEPEGESH